MLSGLVMYVASAVSCFRRKSSSDAHNAHPEIRMCIGNRVRGVLENERDGRFPTKWGKELKERRIYELHAKRRIKIERKINGILRDIYSESEVSQTTLDDLKYLEDLRLDLGKKYKIAATPEQIIQLKRKILTLEALANYKKENKQFSKEMVEEIVAANSYDAVTHPKADEYGKSVYQNKAIATEYGTLHTESLEEFGIVRIKKRERQIAA